MEENNGIMDQYTFSPQHKKFAIGTAIAGVVLLVLGLLMGDDHLGSRIWSNVLICGFFFFGIALTATFFMAVQHAAEAGWATQFKRIMEATGSYMLVGGIILLIVFLAGAGHLHHIYHWMDADAVAHDAILQKKSAYLNIPFFMIRAVVFIGVWILFANKMRKLSLEEDEIGGTEIHFKNQKLSAIFLVFFGFSSSIAAWDWIMSIDAHWFSTLFGWYVFSGMWISCLIFMTLLIIWLKGLGYLPNVNENHIHDMGKWMFGVSCLWTYLWFSQFMLIWYANIPEEVTYFIARFEDYKVIYFTMILANFILPFFILMDKDMKRNAGAVATVGIILFLFHWIDVYMLVTPGVMKADGHFGFIEIGMFLTFLGMFLFIVLNALSKAPLVVKNHPFLDECIHFEQN